MKQLAALLGIGVLAVAGGQAGSRQTTRDAPMTTPSSIPPATARPNPIRVVTKVQPA